MDLQALLPHLDFDTKNLLIADLSIKDDALAQEALSLLTQDYSVEQTLDLLQYFIQRFVEKIDNKELSLVFMKEQIEGVLIDKISYFIKDNSHNEILMTQLIETKFTSFSERCFNQLIELTDEFSHNQKTIWLGLITENATCLSKMSPHITSLKAQGILKDNLEHLSSTSLRNIFANTDFVSWHTVSDNFIKSHENMDGFSNYMMCDYHPVCFRIATIVDLMDNQLDFDIKHQILDVMLKQSSAKDIKVIKKEFEECEILSDMHERNFINVELTQQYFPFSQIKGLEYMGMDLDDFFDYDDIPSTLAFLVSDQKFSLGKTKLFWENEFIEYYQHIDGHGLFDNKDTLLNLLKLSFVAKKNITDNQLLSEFRQWMVNNKEKIEMEANEYEEFHQDKFEHNSHLIEKYIMETTMDMSEQVSISKKIKI